MVGGRISAVCRGGPARVRTQGAAGSRGAIPVRKAVLALWYFFIDTFWKLVQHGPCPAILLPTILSRTQRVRFAPLPDAVVAELLLASGIESGRAREVTRLAAGSVEAGILLADPDESESREGCECARAGHDDLHPFEGRDGRDPARARRAPAIAPVASQAFRALPIVVRFPPSCAHARHRARTACVKRLA